jgi:4a-hydroxytetrahydrobiopterin dehydratase
MNEIKASEQEIKTALAELSGWTVVGGKLHKVYKFKNFVVAMGWMMSVAIEAEKLNHHPEWANVYSKVTVDLVTHDIGNAISNLDLALAQKMEALANGTH